MTTLIAIPDLMFRSKVDATAAQLGASVAQAKRGVSLVEEVRRTGATRVLVDLANVGVDAVRELRTAHTEVEVVGYCRHTAVELMEAGRAAGCNTVLTQGEFSAKLPSLLR